MFDDQDSCQRETASGKRRPARQAEPALSPTSSAVECGRVCQIVFRERKRTHGMLKPLDEIAVPEPQPDEIYRVRLFDHDYSFVGLKSLLGAADFSKAGDRGAGLAASTEVIREAARTILSSLT